MHAKYAIRLIVNIPQQCSMKLISQDTEPGCHCERMHSAYANVLAWRELLKWTNDEFHCSLAIIGKQSLSPWLITSRLAVVPALDVVHTLL